MKVVGQNFWYLISKNKNLYKDIIEPIGYKSKENTEAFLKNKDIITNKFAVQLAKEFCNEDGLIDWDKLVEYNSGNIDIDKIIYDEKTDNSDN